MCSMAAEDAGPLMVSLLAVCMAHDGERTHRSWFLLHTSAARHWSSQPRDNYFKSVPASIFDLQGRQCTRHSVLHELA